MLNNLHYHKQYKFNNLLHIIHIFFYYYFLNILLDNHLNIHLLLNNNNMYPYIKYILLKYNVHNYLYKVNIQILKNKIQWGMKNINSLIKLHIIYKMCMYVDHLYMLNKKHRMVNILNQMD